jgi:hypothetical protein
MFSVNETEGTLFYHNLVSVDMWAVIDLSDCYDRLLSGMISPERNRFIAEPLNRVENLHYKFVLIDVDEGTVTHKKLLPIGGSIDVNHVVINIIH